MQRKARAKHETETSQIYSQGNRALLLGNMNPKSRCSGIVDTTPRVILENTLSLMGYDKNCLNCYKHGVKLQQDIAND